MSGIDEKIKAYSSNSSNTFKSSESNTYDDYFKLYDKQTEVIAGGGDRNEVYKEHLSTASKDKLIDIAIEGNKRYWEERLLSVQQSNEIEKLQNEVILYNNIAWNCKITCAISVISCVTIVGVFYIYQFIKFRLRKYAEKIRKQTIEELKSKD